MIQIHHTQQKCPFTMCKPCCITQQVNFYYMYVYTKLQHSISYLYQVNCSPGQFPSKNRHCYGKRKKLFLKHKLSFPYFLGRFPWKTNLVWKLTISKNVLFKNRNKACLWNNVKSFMAKSTYIFQICFSYTCNFDFLIQEM